MAVFDVLEKAAKDHRSRQPKQRSGSTAHHALHKKTAESKLDTLKDALPAAGGCGLVEVLNENVIRSSSTIADLAPDFNRATTSTTTTSTQTLESPPRTSTKSALAGASSTTAGSAPGALLSAVAVITGPGASDGARTIMQCIRATII